jgi:hypothetical protein
VVHPHLGRESGPMDQTSNLKLPYILAAQSQKHLTHNEALRMLDALVQLAVVDKDLSAPPGSSVEGDCYIVGASPTGAWAGQAKHVAAFQDAAWAFYVPSEGWLAWVADEDILYVFSGTSWIASAGGGGSVNPVSLVGVNATADATNRLSVASPASLFNHEGAGHQLKLNKAAAGDTGSVLFQTGFSGRAEFGLAGDDDFHVKVSADGSAWHEALVINRSTGIVKGPGVRERLVANRSYYVRTDGSDSNSGLANTSGGALLTVQKAIDTVAGLDIGTYNVTINVADGTYTGAVLVNGPWLGSGIVSIVGNTTTPANVIFSTTNANCVRCINGGAISVSGFECRTTTAGSGLVAEFSGVITIGSAMRFGACVNYHIAALNTGSVYCRSSYTISGGAGAHYNLTAGGTCDFSSITVTLTGTPAFAICFATSQGGATLLAIAITFSGSATGTRYIVNYGGLIHTNGAGATYFPGNAAGSGSNYGVSPYGMYL